MKRNIKCSKCLFNGTKRCLNSGKEDVLGCEYGEEMSEALQRLIKALVCMELAGTLDNEMKVFASGYYGECVSNASDLADNLLEEISCYEN